MSNITSFLRVVFTSGYRLVTYLQPITPQLLMLMHYTHTKKLQYYRNNKFQKYTFQQKNK